MPAPTVEYPTPVVGTFDAPGIVFAPAGVPFDAGYPLTFPSEQPGDLGALFPAIVPQAEQIVYQTVFDACQSRAWFPDDSGLTLPLSFSAPLISLYPGRDSTYLVPAGPNAGRPVPPIPVIRGWPAFPGAMPAIGVTESTSQEDQSEDAIGGNFAGDVFATDAFGQTVATAAYYSQPWVTTVVVELVHTNRDERDRLHDQLRRVLTPLKHLIADPSPQVRSVSIDGEKQDLPVDEQPMVFYISLFTVTVNSEALVPTEIVAGGVIEQIITTVTPTEVDLPDAGPNLT